jgi:hypothetical protein
MLLPEIKNLLQVEVVAWKSTMAIVPEEHPLSDIVCSLRFRRSSHSNGTIEVNQIYVHASSWLLFH